MLILYRFLTILLSPLLTVYFSIRLIKGKEDKHRFLERLGITKQLRPTGKLIWFNAVSMGEINSAWTIIKKINKQNKYHILITTTTRTGTETAMRKMKSLDFPEMVMHQYAPIDFSFSIRRFLKHWKPDLLINVESEFWPNIFTMTAKYCPIIVLNGKMSKKSFRFWYRFKSLRKKVFSNVDLCLAQSRNDYKKFINLGLQRVQFLGNIKFFVEKSSVDKKLYEKFLREVGDRPRWLVNCAHDNEEDIIVETHKKLKKLHPNLLTFLVARYPDKLEWTKKLLDQNDIKYVTTTQNSEIAKDIEFFIHDKYGDLGTFFDFCKIVFMGGSLRDGIGGHTPAEAIKHDCCVVTGPYIENNYMLFKELKDVDGCLMLEDNKSDTIFTSISYLLANSEVVKRISGNAYTRSIKYSSVLNEMVDIITDKLVR
ncbi:3-deoxy-D-manno-octulosonic acid transferase [Bacilli bacterium]|nr:3-deoxy-D-manno-octulosonic acid transferase [Bacilli bacterium]